MLSNCLNWAPGLQTSSLERAFRNCFSVNSLSRADSTYLGRGSFSVLQSGGFINRRGGFLAFRRQEHSRNSLFNTRQLNLTWLQVELAMLPVRSDTVAGQLYFVLELKQIRKNKQLYLLCWGVPSWVEVCVPFSSFDAWNQRCSTTYAELYTLLPFFKLSWFSVSSSPLKCGCFSCFAQ